MLLKPNEKVHIVERRQFNEDLRRHFIGSVVECSEFAVRIKGFTWVFDNMRGAFQKRTEPRERIFSLGDRLTLNVISPDVDLNAVVYVAEAEKGLRVTDNKTFSLEITEFSAFR